LTDHARQLSNRLTLTGEVYEIIRNRILNLELPPGTWLKDSELADTLGTSNTPVRESLRRLEAEGLVETIPRRGTFVKRLSQPEVEGLYEVREALEMLAVRLAAQRASDALLKEVAAVAELHLQAVQHGDVNEYLEYDRRFHDLIAVGSDNLTLTSILRTLADRIHIVRRMDLGRRQDESSGHEHLEIAAALSRRDGETAARLMEDHIRLHRGRVLDMLSQEQANDQTGE
jgi:DNA-binding GntR family transcriptional regulator